MPKLYRVKEAGYVLGINVNWPLPSNAREAWRYYLSLHGKNSLSRRERVGVRLGVENQVPPLLRVERKG